MDDALRALLDERFAEIVSSPTRPIPYSDEGIPPLREAFERAESALTDEQREARAKMFTDEFPRFAAELAAWLLADDAP